MGPKRRSFFRRNPALSLSLAAFAVIGAWLAYEITRAVTAIPGLPGRYASTIESMVAESQKDLPGPDAWGEVVHVLGLASSSHRAVLGRFGRPSSSGGFPDAPADWPGDEFWPPDPSDAGSGQVTPRAEAIIREIVAQARADGVLDALDVLSTPRRAIRPIPEIRMIDVVLPELREARSVARLNHARMVFAVTDGDMREFVSAFGQSLGLARIFGYQSTIIDRIIGYGIASLAMTDLRDAIVDGSLDVGTQRLALAIIDRNLPLFSIETALEGERYFMLDTIEWTHTASGRAVPTAMIRLESGGTTGSIMPPPKLAGVMNLGALVMPSREDSILAANTFYDLVIAETRLEAHARPKVSAATEYVENLSPRYVVVKTLAPALSQSIVYESGHITDVAGTRTLIALELHRSERGRYPESLRDLVPEYLDGLPADQFNPAGLTYILKDPTARVTEAFLLYSFGSDLADNQGTFTARGSSYAPGEDMVYNLRRPNEIPRPDR